MGRGFGWVVDTGTYRTHTKNNGASPNLGTFLYAGEKWYGITAHRIASTSGKYPGRINNFHSESVSGYHAADGVSPVAEDFYLPGSSDFDSLPTVAPGVLAFEYSSGCSGMTGGNVHAPSHYTVTTGLDAYIFSFWEILWKTDCTGSLKLYRQVVGSENLSAGPIVNLTNIKTLDPSGVWPGVQFWHGIYSLNFTSGSNIVADHMLSMWGRTPQQAWDDIPALVEFQTNSSNANVATCVALSNLNTDDFPVPDDWASQLLDPPGSGGGTPTTTFPTTAVLSTFTHANENPLSESSAWDGPIVSGDNDVKIVSNQVVSASGQGSAFRTSGAFGPDTEAYIDVPTLPGAGKGVCVHTRLQNAGNPSTAAGYLFCHHTGVGFRFYKLTSGSTFTQVGSTSTAHTLAAGESIGMSAVTTGGAVTLHGYYKSSGVWTEVMQASDVSSPITSAGKIGFQLDDTTVVVDSFGGGTVVVATSTPAPVNSTLPAISGTVNPGSTLSVTNGLWTNVPTSYTYQWRRDTNANSVYVDISGETANSHLIAPGDDGDNIKCVVTATNAGGSTAATSAAAGPVTTPTTPDLAIAITSPLDGATVAGVVTFDCTVTAPSGYDYVQWSIDGVPVDSRITGTEFQIEWLPQTAGSHVIDAKVVDLFGAFTSDSITVTTGLIARTSSTLTLTPHG